MMFNLLKQLSNWFEFMSETENPYNIAFISTLLLLVDKKIPNLKLGRTRYYYK